MISRNKERYEDEDKKQEWFQKIKYLRLSNPVIIKTNIL